MPGEEAVLRAVLGRRRGRRGRSVRREVVVQVRLGGGRLGTLGVGSERTTHGGWKFIGVDVETFFLRPTTFVTIPGHPGMKRPCSSLKCCWLISKHASKWKKKNISWKLWKCGLVLAGSKHRTPSRHFQAEWPATHRLACGGRVLLSHSSRSKYSRSPSRDERSGTELHEAQQV